jgi:hypothetical protein
VFGRSSHANNETKAMPAWEAEKPVRGVQTVSPRQGEKPLRVVQPLPPREAEKIM